MELTVLGCGDAFGNDGRNNTSFLLSDKEEKVLIDCGASTLIRLKHEKVKLESISTIIISHFHGDHYGGIPFFIISSLFENPRKSPLTIIGPKGVEHKVRELQEAMYSGTTEQFDQLDLKFLEYKEGTKLNVGDKEINAWKVEHSMPSLSHGVRLDWRGKKIAFSGDTSWTENLIPLSDGTDIFICECNFQEEVSFGHLSYKELQEKHTLFNTKSLWVSHMADEVIHAKEFEFNRMFDGQKITF